MSGAAYVGLSAGTVVAGGSLLRVTLERSSLYPLAGNSDAYKTLQTNLPQLNAGYITSPFVATPGADVFTLDWRTALGLQKAAGNLVAMLEEPFKSILGARSYTVTRIELLGTKQPGYNSPASSSGESASQASENREQQTAAQQAKPSWFESLASSLGKSADWLITVIKWLAVIILALLAWWFLSSNRSDAMTNPNGAGSPEAAQLILAQIKEQVGPILVQIDKGELDALGGAQQIVQTLGGFLDMLPDNVQLLIRETAGQVVIYLGGTKPVAPAPSREMVLAARPLADTERLELESLRTIVATLNQERPPEGQTYKGRPHQLLKPGDVGYNPATDPNV